MMKKLCLSALSLLLPFAAIADSVEVDGIFYYLDAGTKTAEVTNNPFGYKGSVNIPASVTYSGTDYVVTSIGSRAFHSSTDLTSVTIGDGVTAIGYDAFSYCRSLTSIVIPNSVTDIGYKAFNGCAGLTSITIGSGVNNISYLSFNTNSLELTDVYCLAENVPNTDHP